MIRRSSLVDRIRGGLFAALAALVLCLASISHAPALASDAATSVVAEDNASHVSVGHGQVEQEEHSHAYLIPARVSDVAELEAQGRGGWWDQAADWHRPPGPDRPPNPTLN